MIDGTLRMFDGDGVVRCVFGKLGDGSYGFEEYDDQGVLVRRVAETP